MIQWLLTWYYIIVVCWKYGIVLKLQWYSRTQAHFRCHWGGYQEITLHLFGHDLLHTFLHELGHFVQWRRIRRGGKIAFRAEALLRQGIPRLEFKEEVEAWKFVQRVMRKKFDKRLALSCLKTYHTHHYAKVLKPEQIAPYTDNLVRCLRRLE